FFFQAEDGIRDGHVTGVQTCALPISLTRNISLFCGGESFPARGSTAFASSSIAPMGLLTSLVRNCFARSGPILWPWAFHPTAARSEERRVGKECSSPLWPYH